MRQVASLRAYLTESVHKVVLQESISVQIRQFTLHVGDKLTDLCGN